MKKLKIGVIGTGRFGRLHLNVIQQNPNCKVIAIADINGESLKKTQKDFNIPKTYNNAIDLINDSDVEVVNIVSDESTHGYYAIEAIKQNKHVFIEKPIATSYSQATEIYKLSKEYDVQVMVGNISRFANPYYSIKKAIDRGVLGELATIRAKRDFSKQWFDDFGKRVHPVYESGIHDLDLLLWYIQSDCEKVYAVEKNVSGYSYPDYFSATLTFKNGVIANLDSAWLYPKAAPQNLVETLELDGTINADIEIIGSKGTANFQLNHPGYTIWTNESNLQPELTLWNRNANGIGGAIETELEHFFAQVTINEESSIAPLKDSVDALKIAEAIIESAKQQRVIEL